MEGELIQRMDGFGWIVAAVVVFNIIRALVKGNAEGEGSAPPPPKRRVPKPQRPVKPKVVYPSEDRDAWREVLDQVQRVPQPSTTKPAKRASTPVRQGSIDAWEETASLEVDPTVVSLESLEGDRGSRIDLDYDDEAERIAERRKQAAAARDGAITPADHRRFDEEIRTPAAAKPVRNVFVKADLRKAFIWSEILGRPVSDR
jgi:hypothetical protein